MLDIQGKPLLERLTSTLKKDNIGKISIVSGYKNNVIKNQNNLSNLNIIENKNYANTGELFSLNKSAKTSSAFDGKRSSLISIPSRPAKAISIDVVIRPPSDLS